LFENILEIQTIRKTLNLCLNLTLT
jgi:hypothetical protein